MDLSNTSLNVFDEDLTINDPPDGSEITLTLSDLDDRFQDIISSSKVEHNVIEITYIDSIQQCRRHRKKRINKKWRKKYGMKIIYKKSKGWRFTTDNFTAIKLIKNEELTRGD